MTTKRINQTFIRKCLERRADALISKLCKQPVPPEVIEARSIREAATKIESDWYNSERARKQDIRKQVYEQAAIMEEAIILGADNEEAKALLQQFESWSPQ
jgi:hypothetical protein